MAKYNINELLNSIEEVRGRYVTEYNKALSENKHYKRDYIDEQIKNLEQVEDILKAWEVVNTDFKICFDEEEKGYEGYFIRGKDYYGKNSAVFSYIKSHYQIIKKSIGGD